MKKGSDGRQDRESVIVMLWILVGYQLSETISPKPLGGQSLLCSLGSGV